MFVPGDIGALGGGKSCSSCLSHLAADVWSSLLWVGFRFHLTQYFDFVISFSANRFARFWKKALVKNAANKFQE